MTAQCCTLTKSYTVLAWQLTTANIKHVLSLGWERESASDAPDRTNRWWWWGEFFFPVVQSWIHSSPNVSLVWVIHLFDARLPFVRLYLASDVYLMVFRSASTSTSRLAEKPGQDTQLITVDEKLVRIPARATWPTDWCLSDPPITFLEKKVQNPPYLLPEWAWSRQKAFVTIWRKWQMSSVVGLCVLIAPINPLLC